MKKHISAVIFLIFGAAVLTSAQSIEQEVIKAHDQFSDIKNRSLELERVKRESYKRPAEETTVKFPEIKEDFERMQKINSDFLQPAFAKSSANYEAFSKAATEINHRASRLHSNLFSFEAEKEKGNKKSIEPTDLKILLIKLDRSINDFVHSSIFQNIQIVNPNDSARAQKDLESVIKISQLIKETATKTMKVSAKNQSSN